MNVRPRIPSSSPPPTRLCSVILLALLLLPLAGCRREREDLTPDGRVKITYWEKWTSFEGEAIAEVVKAFNRSQDEIYVELLTVSQIERKLLVAVAGGDPPDVAGIYTFILYSYADQGALQPLDEDKLREAGITRDYYVPIYWDMCKHQGQLWALPTTPATTALHWNKRLFREAGLDADVPPKTIKELDEFAEKLTKWDEDGNLVQVGFLPQEPGWWAWSWGFWFGGQIWDGESTITACSPENLEGYRWVRSYSEKYGRGLKHEFEGSLEDWIAGGAEAPTLSADTETKSRGSASLKIGNWRNSAEGHVTIPVPSIHVRRIEGLSFSYWVPPGVKADLVLRLSDDQSKLRVIGFTGSGFPESAVSLGSLSGVEADGQWRSASIDLGKALRQELGEESKARVEKLSIRCFGSAETDAPLAFHIDEFRLKTKSAIEQFAGGFGNFSSPQNAFLSGKVAMEVQGVWMHNFIEKYAPGLEWGAAPFPAVRADLTEVTNAEADVIVIPRDSRHPEEALKFIQFVNSQKGMELLCSGHRKFSPLKEVSPEFAKMNPPGNPYLKMFRDLSYSPNAFSTPKLGVWNEYRRELGVAFDRIRLLETTPEEALGFLQRRIQNSFDREARRMQRREQKR